MDNGASIIRMVRHTGVSFASGVGNLHFWVKNGDAPQICARWVKFLVKNGLADELYVELNEENIVYCIAKTYLFLPFFAIRDVIMTTTESETDSALADQLAMHSLDARMYSKSYGLYYAIAQFRGWIAMPFLLGRQPAILIGIGKFSQLMAMNLPPSVSSIISASGSDKAYCRSLLVAHGFNVAPGAIATTAEQARARAVELGFPIALKIAQGGGNSEGVILNIQDEQTCADAAQELLVGGHILVVERMVPGIELRLHFIRGTLFRVLQSEAFFVVGDGKSSLEMLLQQQYPGYFKVMMGTKHHQRRLIFQLFSLGVRSPADLTKIVPEAGMTVRVSAATGSNNMAELEPTTALCSHDRAALEAFLTRYGAPSAGIDIILQHLGASLAEGGAILEMNIPCGFGYLNNQAPRAADLELLDTAKRCDGFLAAQGRVPVFLATEDEYPDGSTKRTKLVERFLSEHGGGKVANLTRANGWLQVLNESSASAFLVLMNEDTIIEHGMPAHLRPTVFHAEQFTVFATNFPKICATTRNAGGHFIQEKGPP